MHHLTRAAAAASVAALALGGAALPAPASASPAGADPVASARSSALVGAVTPAAADARIAAKLRSRLRNPALGTDVAVRVFDPATGLTVFRSQSNESQLPASNMKVVTAFTALTTLGPATRLPTRVVRGATSGSVVLVGGGDPMLSSADLRLLADRTLARFVATSPTHAAPKGLVVSVDDSLFPRPTRAAGWTSSYGLGEISPVRALGRHGVAASDTTTDAVGYFMSRLRMAGVSVNYTGRTRAPASRAEVARVAGHRVDQDVRQMLLHSDNQVAETLFRQVALRTGRAATWSGATAAARAVLTKAGVPSTGAAFVDGSGLSRSDRVTAVLLVRILRRASVGAPARLTALVPGLPVAGWTGTLEHRYRTAPTSCAAGVVRAKTGFVNGVVALSGVTRGADGKLRVFSVVANHIPTARYSVTATQRAVDALAATVTGCY